jgi:hypothetical protein
MNVLRHVMGTDDFVQFAQNRRLPFENSKSRKVRLIMRLNQ